MFSPADTKSVTPSSLDPLDRVAIGYLTLPLAIFLIGWLEWWVAVPLVACVAYSLRWLAAAAPPAAGTRLSLTALQLCVAVFVGCAWTVFGGTEHLLFANSDWYVRDAVLHDLVNSPWPVGYGLVDGNESLLRAPIAYFLPAALVGKAGGLPMAHFAMAVWTALGAALFLMQVLSLTPSRTGAVILATAITVLFSGMDIVGSILNGGPRFIAYWHIASHIEWWAVNYQYSSMTTQLFWVPNHALGGWLMVGLLWRNPGPSPLDFTLPILIVAAALWSPLTAIGVVPFALWKVYVSMSHERSSRLLHPRVWVPALAVGIVMAAYLALDAGGIPKGWSVSKPGETTLGLMRWAQFFLLEAGFIGAAILAIRRSAFVVLALVILALLPLVHLGPGNDLVMRASIPSLAVLAIGACLALTGEMLEANAIRKRVLLGCLLAIGAVTAIQEIARATVLRAWPINFQVTLIGVNCGHFPPHYVARLSDQFISRLLRRPHRLALGPLGQEVCTNPAIDLMSRADLL